MTQQAQEQQQGQASQSRNPLQISLHSCDDKIFRLSSSQAKISKLVTNTVEDDNRNDYDDMDADIAVNENVTSNNVDVNVKPNDTVIFLPNVDSQTLTHIIEFMKHYSVDPLHPISSPFQGSSLTDIITQEWYISFINSMDRNTLFQVINGADYMDIEPLLNLGCLAVSVSFMGKDAEEIRKLLNIEKLSEDDELRTREDHAWMFS